MRMRNEAEERRKNRSKEKEAVGEDEVEGLKFRGLGGGIRGRLTTIRSSG